MNTLINIGMYIVYILLVTGLLAIIGFSLYQFAGNFKNNKGALYAILALVVIFVIAYLCASTTDVSAAVIDKAGTTHGALKMIGAGINMVYILVCACLLALVGLEAAKAFKK